MNLTDSLSELCRLYVLVALAFSAVGKAVAFGDFRRSVSELVFLGARGAAVVSGGVLLLEILISLALISGGSPARLGLYTALPLFIAFTGVLAVALVQRRRVACNCFGRSERPIAALDLARNGLFMAACALGVSLPSVRSAAPAALAALLGVALILFLVTSNLREVALVFSPGDASQAEIGEGR